jgi:hypothetical protein
MTVLAFEFKKCHQRIQLGTTKVYSLCFSMIRGRIFSHVQPFYERAVSYQDRSMHRSLWVLVAHSSFIEGSDMTKHTASGDFYNL